MKPEVLVLDEPTAGLDPENRTALINNLIFLNRKKGVTVILVSHSMDEVVEIADRLVVMHEGHISAIGEIHEVFSDERIASEYDPIVPQAARLLYNLKSGGVPVNLGAFKIDESVSEILRAFKAKKGKNR